MHLAYELLDGYDAAILVDATSQGGDPGTIYVIEPDVDAIETENGLAEAGIVDAHGMDPASVLALLRSLGGQRRPAPRRRLRAGRRRGRDGALRARRRRRR